MPINPADSNKANKADINIDTNDELGDKPLPSIVTSDSQASHVSHLQQLSRQIEVLLHASEAPLTHSQLQEMLKTDTADIDAAIDYLNERLQTSVLSLVITAAGYRLQIQSQYSGLIAQVWPDKPTRLSRALLETLSVIAYKQPVTRADIEMIRGVSVSSHLLRQLFDKGWIVEQGHKDTLGRPALLHTTALFLDAFGLKTLADLPQLTDIEADIDTP